jgi:hypothetical protein
MKKFLLLLAILISGSLFLMGCGGSDDDSTVAPPAATSDDSDADEAVVPDPNAAFAAIIPAGLALEDKFSISGRGIAFTVRCNAIPGAASYVFTTSFGGSESVVTPEASFLKAGADEPFTLSVYAINANGFNSKTASASLN